MNDTCIIKISPERALDRIFESSPKSSPVRLISCVDRFGDMFITENIKCFVPYSNNHTEKAMSSFRELFHKPRRSKIITVGGLERYLKYKYKQWIGDCQKDGNSNSNRSKCQQDRRQETDTVSQHSESRGNHQKKFCKAFYQKANKIEQGFKETENRFQSINHYLPPPLEPESLFPLSPFDF